MTDNEIIQALECFKSEDCLGEQCPYFEMSGLCGKPMCSDVYDFIYRQKSEIEKLTLELEGIYGGVDLYKREYDIAQAEIERLQKAGEEAVSCFTRMESLYKIKCKELEVAKSEAYREFAERFKYFVLHEDIEIVDCKCTDYQNYVNGANQFRHQVKNGIDNTLKELTEDNK